MAHPLRSDRHFHHAVQAFTKQIVSCCYVVKGERVRQQRREIDASIANNLHKPTHALFATRTKRCHDPVIADTRCECFIRNVEFAGIHHKTRQRTRRSQTAQCALKRLLSAKSFNRYICAATGQTFYLSYNIDISIVEGDVGTHTFRHRESMLVAVDTD